MTIALAQPITVEQFLDWEDHQALRHEFDGIDAFAMTGGTGAHAAIQASLLRALGNHLDGKPCRAYGSELKVKMATSARYPDAIVTCPPVAPKATFATDPVVIFEILLKLGHAVRHNDAAAVAVVGVAWLDVQHRRLGQGFVRRLVHGIAQRRQGRLGVEQRAVHRSDVHVARCAAAQGEHQRGGLIR